MIGKVIGDKYVLLKKIGQGGSGSVYLARDLRLGKQWAVKVLEEEDGREASVLKSFEHSMIPRIVDCLKEQGKIWLVMDYISGRNLSELQRSKALSRNRLLDLAIDLCQVLSYLHSLKPPYIYGDLKPENLILTHEGKLFLVDFGAGAKRYRGICEGTPVYMAPEQAEGIATCRSDIYSFGKTWQSLLGEPVSRDWRRIMDKCCQRSPKKRYQKVQELEKCLKRMKRKRENRCLLFLSVSALVICATAGYLTGNREKGVRKIQEIQAGSVSAVGNEVSENVEKTEENGECLGKIAERLGQAVGLPEGAARQQRFSEVTDELEGFYQKETQRDWKLRSGLLLAWSYWKNGETEKAEEVYLKILASYPDSGECYGSYGCLLAETGASKERQRDLYERAEQMATDKEGYNYQVWTRYMEELEG